ncbi:hypothetical protein CBL_07150 [Carabus blaptoides fortunei]
MLPTQSLIATWIKDYPELYLNLNKEWLANIGTPELFVKSYSTLNWLRVCSKHFTVDQYQYLGSKRLNPGAIPTIVAPSTLTLPAKLSALLREAIDNAEDTPATELPGTSGIPISLEPPMPSLLGKEIRVTSGLQNVSAVDLPGTSGLSRPEPSEVQILELPESSGQSTENVAATSGE